LDEDALIEDQIPEGDFVDLSYYKGDYNETGELGHEEHQLDLTNFDGDNDERMPGESSLNRKLKKEGTIRRALTRKIRVPRKGKQPFSESRRASESLAFNAETIHLLASPTHHRRSSSGQSSDMPAQYDPSRPLLPSASVDPQEELPLGDWDTTSRTDQFAEGSLDWKRRSVSSFSQASTAQPLVPQAAKGVELEVGDQEMRDVSVMAEFALPGRPKLDAILRDEVERAGGRVVLACE